MISSEWDLAPGHVDLHGGLGIGSWLGLVVSNVRV